MRTPMILTSGAWHGAWCWSLVAEELAALGVGSVAVDLDGFGGLRGASPDARWSRPWSEREYRTARTSAAEVTLDTAADALVGHLRRITGERPCVLVCHSLGGIVGVAAAERAPELVARLVFVTAMTPVVGMTGIAYNALPEMRDSLLLDNIVADPVSTGCIRIDPLAEPGRTLALRSFYPDVAQARAHAAASMLGSDAPAAIGTEAPRVTTGRFGAVPRTYVVCTRDRILTPATQYRLIRELDSVAAEPTTVRELDSGHSPFLSCPERLAGILAG